MKGMTVIVKTVSSWVKVLIFLFGIYIILFGHLTPGGGFAGGVILASSYVLLMLAFGRKFVEENLLVFLIATTGSIIGSVVSVWIFGPVLGGGTPAASTLFPASVVIVTFMAVSILFSLISASRAIGSLSGLAPRN